MKPGEQSGWSYDGLIRVNGTGASFPGLARPRVRIRRSLSHDTVGYGASETGTNPEAVQINAGTRARSLTPGIRRYFLKKAKVRFVASVFHLFDWNEMEGG